MPDADKVSGNDFAERVILITKEGEMNPSELCEVRDTYCKKGQFLEMFTCVYHPPLFGILDDGGI